MRKDTNTDSGEETAQGQRSRHGTARDLVGGRASVSEAGARQWIEVILGIVEPCGKGA
jgi:hypothetical protein